jgi:hypothetical protein
MSKPGHAAMIYRDYRLWARFKGLSLPQVIEWQAKGFLRQEPDGVYLLEVKKHKPQHTKGKTYRFYVLADPKRRPLLTTGYSKAWREY